MTDLLPDTKSVRRRAWGMAKIRADIRTGGEVDAELDPKRRAPHFGSRRLARAGEALASVPALDRSGAHPAAPPRNEPHPARGRARDADALRWQRLPRAAWQRLGPRRLATLVALSVLVNLALLTLALFGGGRATPSDEETPIPIQLVLNHPPEPSAPPKPPPPPPPPPKAAEKQKQTPPPPPPPGRLASDEMGDVDATGKAPVPEPGPAAGKPQLKAGEAPPPPAEAPPTPTPSEVAVPKPVDDPAKSTAPKQAELPPTPEQLAAAGALAPPPPPPKPEPPAETPVAKPVPKPALKLVPQLGGARKPTPEPEAEDHGEGHKAAIPGSDASRDEYLAYVKDLLLEHRDMLSAAVTGERHGVLDLDIRINARGSILQVFVRHSSGYPDLDKRAIEMTYAAGQLPPVPERLLERGYLGALFHMSVPLAQ